MAGLDDRSSAKDDGTTRCYGIASGTTARSQAHCQARQTRWSASDRRGVKGEASSVRMGIELRIGSLTVGRQQHTRVMAATDCSAKSMSTKPLPPSVLRFPQVRAPPALSPTELARGEE